MDRRESVIEDITGPITVTFTDETINVVVDVNVTACYQTGRSIMGWYMADNLMWFLPNQTKLIEMLTYDKNNESNGFSTLESISKLK